MRILVVSAHYPPDFVSGGTLVPQRLARELAGLGHDVTVYAGSLDAGRPPLSVWNDRDDTGLPIRWIAISPWIGWADRANFDNPKVAEDFASFLSVVRPDVVHFHSMQSLGCGLVESAKAQGCLSVLTMHDFWWVCARQFLVDKQFHPCSLVVDAGNCRCEVDRSWLNARNDRLRRALRGVDLALAPSASAVEVLRANGVAVDRLEVDENGVVPAILDPPLQSNPRSPSDLVAFMYAGGPEPMKGSEVLIQAAERVSVSGGWRIAAYGLGDKGARVPPGVPIDILPPFPEHKLGSALAEADALILPSIMRETFSVLTREALAAGVPVIATDTLGPEEVIRDGVNGLIVPAGDPDALARAMDKLIEQPALLQRLQQGAQAVPLRSVNDQAVGLERRYRALLDSQCSDKRQETRPLKRSIERVVFVVGIDGAPLRYRARLPAEALGLLKIRTHVRHYRNPDLPDLLARADAVVFYRVPATTQVLELIASVRRNGRPVLFDVDDLIFDPDLASEIPALSILPPDEAALWMEGVRRYRTTMEACDLFVGSTDALCRHAQQVTGLPAARFANGVGILLAQQSERARSTPREPGPVRIGYFSGTTTHDRDWGYIERAVLDCLAGHADAELWLGGYLKPSSAVDALGGRVRRLPMVPWSELPSLLRQVDVNLAPLEPGSRFNDAKSAIKWLEAALVDTPTIASPSAPFRESISDWETGVLASSPGEWGTALDRLLKDPDERQAIGVRACRRALLTWSPHIQGRRYRDILEEAVEVAEARRPRSSSWTPVVLDEPPIPSELESYMLEVPPVQVLPPAPHVPSFVARVRRLVRRGGGSLRRDGVRITACRTIAVGRRALRTRLNGIVRKRSN